MHDVWPWRCYPLSLYIQPNEPPIVYTREFGIRNAIKKLNRQLEKVVGSFGNFADI